MRINDKQLEFLCWDWEDGETEDCEMSSYAADFETTTLEEDCRVWAWATSKVGDSEDIQIGNTIEGFLVWCEVHPGCKAYFHNLKFDGKFLLSHMLINGWRWIPDKSKADNKTFTTLISDMGQFYSIKIWFDSQRSIEFLDSLKVIPLPIAAIPKAFGLDIEKLDLNYTEFREKGYVLTDKDVAYISHDVKIASLALNIMFTQDMKRMTAGSNAFSDYKKTVGGKRRFRDWFPEPDYDEDLRKGGCYKGGFTAVNDRFVNRILGSGVSFDVNSLYPSVMASAHGELLPYGTPIAYDGTYIPDPGYPLFIQYLECDFSVKKDHIPCMMLKGNSRFGATEYIRDSEGMQTICLTSADLELFFEQYDVYEVKYLRGYKFKGSHTLFRKYVDKWTEVKTQATLDGNEGMRTLAKLQLNSLYGKLATNPVKVSKKPYLNEEGVVKYAALDPEYAEAVYLPAGAFITSHARAYTIRAAQANYGRWLYSDTDSNYFIGTEPVEGLEVDPVKLGAWKHEHTFDRFKMLGPKAYCFEAGGELTVHCAGMSYRCHEHVTMENFGYGSSFDGKLTPKDVKGGIILMDDRYTIHDRRTECLAGTKRSSES